MHLKTTKQDNLCLVVSLEDQEVFSRPEVQVRYVLSILLHPNLICDKRFHGFLAMSSWRGLFSLGEVLLCASLIQRSENLKHILELRIDIPIIGSIVS